MKITLNEDQFDSLNKVDTVAVVNPAYNAAKIEHDETVERVEKEKEDLLKQSGISEEELANGFAGAGKNNEKAVSNEATKKMHLSESLFEDFEGDAFEKAWDSLDINPNSAVYSKEDFLEMMQKVRDLTC